MIIIRIMMTRRKGVLGVLRRKGFEKKVKSTPTWRLFRLPGTLYIFAANSLSCNSNKFK